MEQNQNSIKRLYRSRTNRIIFGVCGGLGEYFGIDPIIFRLIFLALTFGGGAGILLYIVMAFLVPNEPSGKADSELYSIGVDFKERVQGLVSELKEHQNWQDRRNWIGLIIIILGALLLLDQLFPRHFFNWGIFWAVLIIALGILILRGKKRINNKSYDSPSEIPSKNPASNETSQKEVAREIHRHHHHRHRGVWGLFFGLLLIVLGVAFLLQNLGLVSGINFAYVLRFWPVLIIFCGLSILSRGTWVGAVLSVIFALVIIGLIIFSFFWPAQTAEIQKYNFDIQKDTTASRAEI